MLPCVAMQKYQFKGKIGSGQFGVVWRVGALGGSRSDCAVKRLEGSTSPANPVGGCQRAYLGMCICKIGRAFCMYAPPAGQPPQLHASTHSTSGPSVICVNHPPLSAPAGPCPLGTVHPAAMQPVSACGPAVGGVLWCTLRTHVHRAGADRPPTNKGAPPPPAGLDRGTRARHRVPDAHSPGARARAAGNTHARTRIWFSDCPAVKGLRSHCPPASGCWRHAITLRFAGCVCIRARC